MGLFNRKQRKLDLEAERHIIESTIEIVDIKKRRADHSAAVANKDIDQLKDLLQRNGITLKIVVAAQRNH